MRELLEQKFFPYVIRPGRYCGGESGQIIKDPAGRLKYLHAYPDKYEIGQSYVGLQTLYNIVNGNDRFLCERVFAVDLDAEELMRREKIPLFSLESSTPAKDFDVIGFTLVDETVYTNVLTMLDLAGLALRSADRTDRDPIIMAGGPAVYNPEPLAPFVDLFFIGDAEEGLPEMLSLLHEQRNESKEQKLRALASIESVYIPRYYDHEVRPLVDFVPEKIKARTVSGLKPEYYPEQPIVPLVDTVHNHLAVEIMRGCPQGCKFCFAGPIYRPVRPRPAADIARQIETQLDNTGYDEVTLLSLSATDYPDLEQLVLELAEREEPRRVSISLPSLRPDHVSSRLLDALRTVRRSGMTIAPEAGSERLRRFIRKDFPDQAIFNSARLAYSKGWPSIKLYFILGLPTETDEDLLGIANICRRIYQIGREYSRKATVNVALSPFVPKPHTPFQWDQAEPEEIIYEKIKFVKKSAGGGQVHIRHNSTRLAMLLACLGRGGRETADVIESAYLKGCRFDGWSEHFLFDKWLEAFAENNLDPAARLQAIPFSQKLPWSHIVKGPSAEHLIRERERTPAQPEQTASNHKAAALESDTVDDAALFGRGRKRVANRTPLAPTKNRVRLRWGKSARYRYMSHLENLRLMERALRRARLPVSYSQGHNPTMRLSLGPALPLGFTSETEFVDVTLESNLMPYMIDNLKTTLPAGINILDARAVLGKKASLNSALNRVEYTLPVTGWFDREDLLKTIDRVLQTASLKCDRITKHETKTIDIRPAVYDLAVQDDTLVLTLGLGEAGYARPTEVAGFLTNGLKSPPEALPFHRRDMYRIDDKGDRINAMDL